MAEKTIELGERVAKLEKWEEENGRLKRLETKADNLQWLLITTLVSAVLSLLLQLEKLIGQ